MSSFLESIADKIDRLNLKIGRAASRLVLVMVLVTFLTVILRYVFQVGWVWMQEITTYSHGFLFLLGASYTMLKDEHVRVDIFYRKMSPKRRAFVDLFGTFFLLFPMVFLIFYQALPYVVDSWEVFEGSKDGGGLEAVFVQKSAILLFCVLLGLQGVSVCLRSFLTLIGLGKVQT